MKRHWESLLKFLRDPAVQTITQILAILIPLTAIIVGTIRGWFVNFYAWLTDKLALPNWLALLLIIAISTLGVYWIRRVIGKETKKPETKPTMPTVIHYHEVWGVLWGWPPPRGRYIGDGPLCPIHKLPVHSEKVRIGSDQYYEFKCPGNQGEAAHKIRGPKLSQLVTGGWTGEPDLYADVNARLKAEIMK